MDLSLSFTKISRHSKSPSDPEQIATWAQKRFEAPALDKSGLTGGVWFAVKTENTVYAVLELLGQNIVPPTEERIVEIEAFGFRLGHLLNEKEGRF